MRRVGKPTAVVGDAFGGKVDEVVAVEHPCTILKWRPDAADEPFDVLAVLLELGGFLDREPKELCCGFDLRETLEAGVMTSAESRLPRAMAGFGSSSGGFLPSSVSINARSTAFSLSRYVFSKIRLTRASENVRPEPSSRIAETESPKALMTMK